MKNIMKKIICVLLFAAVLFSFSSCSALNDILGNFGIDLGGDDAKTPGSDGELRVAMTVGDYKIDEAEYRFNYESEINDFYDDYYAYLEYFGLDLDQPLSEQMYDDEITWADYFSYQAESLMAETYYLYLEAVENGFELSDEQIADFTAEMENTSLYIAEQGYTEDEYLQLVFGEGVTMERYRKYVWTNLYVYYYYLSVLDGFDFSETDYRNYYNENKKSFDSADCYAFYFSYSDDADAEKARDAAEDMYVYLMNSDNAIADFENYVYENHLNDEEKEEFYDGMTLASDIFYDDVFEELADWLFDDSRKANDTDMFEYGSGYYVVTFVQRSLDEYNTVNVRHILKFTDAVNPVYLDDGETIDYDATEAAQEAADAEVLASVERVLDLWKAGDMSEQSFADLAKIYTEDTGSQSNGGLYENCRYNEFIAEFEDWIFDGSRKAGDYDIIQTYYGYHLMYFVGEGMPSWMIDADNALRAAAYDDYYYECAEKYEVLYDDSVIDDIKAN